MKILVTAWQPRSRQQNTELLNLCLIYNLFDPGIITREDAEKCLEHDVQGIIVSNHGGRQLDGTPATVNTHKPLINDLSIYTWGFKGRTGFQTNVSKSYKCQKFLQCQKPSHK